jgi:CxxC motif-containing protein
MMSPTSTPTLSKELICIVCPNGCEVRAKIDEEGPDLKVLEIEGCTCEKGEDWVVQELTNPMRTIASSIPMDQGNFKLVSVRTDSPIPLEKIMDVMTEIKKIKAKAPISIGDILIHNPAGTPCNIIATRHVETVH